MFIVIDQIHALLFKGRSNKFNLATIQWETPSQPKA